MNPVWYVESPNLSEPFRGDHSTYSVSFWIAWPNGSDLSRLTFGEQVIDELLVLREETRPDVENVYPGMSARGFRGVCASSVIQGRDSLRLQFECKGKQWGIDFPTRQGAEGTFEQKAEKMSRLRDRLRCPSCLDATLSDRNGEVVCVGCGRSYSKSARCVDFTKRQLSVNAGEDSPQSANLYDPESINLIHRFQSGLVLDYGAGVRQRYFDNVVNYEIFPNDTVDVLGDGDRLPFADESFDAAISIAVFEHLSDPFGAAREILRVLKPGGVLYLQVPFLFHEHGYPGHFYNMTQAGLVNLFGAEIAVKRLEVIDYGQPICLLTIFLDHYVKGLPPQVAESFSKMQVGDFLSPYFGHLHREYVTALDEDTKRKLACVNALIAEKK
jgi:SAM-dependent methyltransferase